MEQLGRCLNLCKNLSQCDLSRVGLTDEPCRALFSTLKFNGVLTCLNVGGNYIGPTGATAIAEALRGNEVLTKLDLSVNYISDEGVKALASALLVNEVLTSLDVRGNEIGSTGAAAIAEALRGNEVLKSLDVRCNKISGDAAQQLATAVLASPSLEIFGLVPLKELRANTLDKLDLSGKGLGVPEALVLAKLVEGSEVLKSVDLRGNSLGTEGWCAIFAALRDNKENKIESWDLSHQGINAEVAKVLAEYVSVSGVLKSINLEYNNLGDEGKGVIRDAVSGRVGFELKM
ncbi:hypothetical protein EMIHUDRAFT_64618 [Emiliania huxleyi CCMP1516]|uniref:Uncharacterized protein n=2 Tax=Emiliania huxleyi TaxID=2903 RepID=A0A0D3JSU1_EMIH1|nr:hypothetical protein EMIHUDRAFT_64618 [Emiliania huxleyi CCMP1516]EOD26576.1 hypothetical protein EMIHUDRAFT_64618 [Emiliania huxleyi CCMP1516]|eukprot:XP_005779005.1 hypothetical protein EMIHUDRAFT_64618 [Emiliania huxleyi CCMP1516]